MSDREQRLSRAERRRQTEERILGAARALFAELGYERTTIRAVAAEASVDPALVMQYFGSKDALFQKAVGAPPDESLLADPDRLTEHLLATIGIKLGDLPQASLAALRSMLTHPETADRIRSSQNLMVQRISAAIGSEDAELRASLAVAFMTGISIERHLIGLDPLTDAQAEQIITLLRPCFDVLIRNQPAD